MRLAIFRAIDTAMNHTHHTHHHEHNDNCAPGDLEHHMAIATRVCEQSGVRFTALRAHVFELVISADGPVKAYDILDRMRPDVGSPKPPTVYRALDFLSRLGLVHRVEALNAYVACDHTHDGQAAQFFICESCDSVQERHADNDMPRAPEGFSVTRSVIEHYGQCQKCASAA